MNTKELSIEFGIKIGQVISDFQKQYKLSEKELNLVLVRFVEKGVYLKTPRKVNR